MKDFDPDNPLMLANWFDPHNTYHLKAYVELGKGLGWPREFVASMEEEGVIIHSHWDIFLTSRMVKCWLEEKLGK